MGAQRASFAADSAEPEPPKDTADGARSEPLCRLVTEDGDNRPDIGPAIEPSEYVSAANRFGNVKAVPKATRRTIGTAQEPSLPS